MTPNQFLELLASASMQAGIIIVLTHWFARLCIREQIAGRLWYSCFVLLLATVIAGVSLPHLRMLHPWVSIQTVTVASVARWQMQIGAWLFTAWLIGAGITICMFAWQLIQTHRFVNSCEDISLRNLVGDAIAAELLEVMPFQLRAAAFSPSPFCWQFYSPCIVLPKSILSLAPSELRLILKHEVEHLRVGHPLELFVQRLAEVIFWFHPMVWWASHEAALAREFACDDAAVTSKNEVAEYLRTLLKVVEIGAAESDSQSANLAFGRGSGSIASRARRLVEKAYEFQRSRPRAAGRSHYALFVAIATVVIAFAWLPINALASSRSLCSPWPKWSASALHNCGVSVRDYEEYDGRSQLYELDLEAQRPR